MSTNLIIKMDTVTDQINNVMNYYLHKLLTIAKQNKYTIIYQLIIERALSRIPDATSLSKYALRKKAKLIVCNDVEGHHIFPRSLCTTRQEQDDIHNYAFLTFKEHLLCHKLLATKMFENQRLNAAFHAMFSRRNKKQNSKLMTLREAEWVRQHSKLTWGHPGKENGMFGKHHSDNTRLKMSRKSKGRKRSVETKLVLSNAQLLRKEKNSWNQLLSNQLYCKFVDYNDFITKVINAYDVCHRNPRAIALLIEASESGVITALRHLGLPAQIDQRFSKLVNNYGNQFTSFQEYEDIIVGHHTSGLSPTQIANVLSVNPAGISKVLKCKNITPNKSKPGPRKSSPL